MANILILSLNFTRNRLVFVPKLLCSATLCRFVYGLYLLFIYQYEQNKRVEGDLSWHLLLGCDYSDILSVELRPLGVEDLNES